MGAAEDQGVDPRALERRAVGAHRLDHLLVEREAALDDRREVGGRDLGHRELAALGAERPQVGAARDRRRRREHADPPGVGDRGRDLRLGLDHRDHLHPALRRRRARRLEPGRGGGVAGDHDQLRAAVEQVGGVALDAGAQLLVGLGSVGKARVVAEVEVVLLRQRDEALVQDGEPADAGVEDGDRQRRIWAGGHPANCRGLRDCGHVGKRRRLEALAVVRGLAALRSARRALSSRSARSARRSRSARSGPARQRSRSPRSARSARRCRPARASR